MTRSHIPNPLIDGDADDVCAHLVAQLEGGSPPDAFGVFRGRAAALFAALAPSLVWLRDHRSLRLDAEAIRSSLDLRWIGKLATEKVVVGRGPSTGEASEVAVPDIPAEVIWPLRRYLGELPGWDRAVLLEVQASVEPWRQHSYVAMYAAPALARLSGARP